MLQSIYIDKVLKDIQCVQTLSRLNRTMTGKASTFVLDFTTDETIGLHFKEIFEIGN